MDFGTNKRSVEVIKEGAFRGIYFRDTYSSVNHKWYKNSWKEFDDKLILIKSIIAQIIMMLVLINMVSNVENH